jgi:hypothetical protein
MLKSGKGLKSSKSSSEPVAYTPVTASSSRSTPIKVVCSLTKGIQQPLPREESIFEQLTDLSLGPEAPFRQSNWNADLK